MYNCCKSLYKPFSQFLSWMQTQKGTRNSDLVINSDTSSPTCIREHLRLRTDAISYPSCPIVCGQIGPTTSHSAVANRNYLGALGEAKHRVQIYSLYCRGFVMSGLWCCNLSAYRFLTQISATELDTVQLLLPRWRVLRQCQWPSWRYWLGMNLCVYSLLLVHCSDNSVHS